MLKRLVALLLCIILLTSTLFVLASCKEGSDENTSDISETEKSIEGIGSKDKDKGKEDGSRLPV